MYWLWFLLFQLVVALEDLGFHQEAASETIHSGVVETSAVVEAMVETTTMEPEASFLSGAVVHVAMKKVTIEEEVEAETGLAFSNKTSSPPNDFSDDFVRAFLVGYKHGKVQNFHANFKFHRFLGYFSLHLHSL